MKNLVLAASVVAFSMGAFAQTPGEGASPRPEHAWRHGVDAKKIDLNADGFISRDEAKGHRGLDKGFDRIDSNGDGKLSQEEMAAFRVLRKEHSKLDADGDGLVTREEAKGRPVLQKRFDEIDTNHDQRLSREELRAARRQQRGQKA